MIALVVAAVALAGVGAWWFERRRGDRVLARRSSSEVIVSLKSGESFSGVLFDRDPRCLVLRNAVNLQPHANVPVDGELLVLWAEVAYVQKP